jgi:hypothetical protein
MTIEPNQTWISKKGNQRVLVLRVLNYTVSYQQDGFIKQMGDFEFKDHFKFEGVQSDN